MTTPVFKDHASFVVSGTINTTDTTITLSGATGRLPTITAGEQHAHVALQYALKPDKDDSAEATQKNLQRWELRKVTAVAGNVLTMTTEPVASHYPTGEARAVWQADANLQVVATFVVSEQDLQILTQDWDGLTITGSDTAVLTGMSEVRAETLTATGDVQVGDKLFITAGAGITGIDRGSHWPSGYGAVIRENADVPVSPGTGGDLIDRDKRLVAFKSEIASALHQVSGNELVVPLATAPTDYVPIGGEQGDALWVADAGGGSASVIAGHADHLEDVLDFGSDGTTFEIRAGSPQGTGWDSVSVTWRASLKGGFEEVVFPLPGGKTLADLREALTLSLRKVSTFDSTGVIVSDRLFLYNEPRTILSGLRPTDADAAPDPAELPVGTLWRRAASGLETAVFVKQSDGTWRRRRTPMHILTVPGIRNRPNGIIAWADMDDHFDDFSTDDHDFWQMIYQTDQNDGRFYASGGSDVGSITTTLGIEDDREGHPDYGCSLAVEDTGVRFTVRIGGTGTSENIGYRVIFLPRNDED